jgi:hypothetical protein
LKNIESTGFNLVKVSGLLALCDRVLLGHGNSLALRNTVTQIKMWFQTLSLHRVVFLKPSGVLLVVTTVGFCYISCCLSGLLGVSVEAAF